MKLMLSVLLLFTLWVLVGAEPPQNPKQEKRTVQSAAASAVVLLSLDEFFSGQWGYGKIFIEANALVPLELNQVGKYEAQVVSIEELRRQYAGKATAPAMVTIRLDVVQEKGEPVYNVSISYTGISVEGASNIPLGGGKEYRYKVNEGKAVLIKSNSTHY